MLPFDFSLRAQMVKGGLIPKLVELLKRPPYRARGLRLLYHMSIDDRCKAMFAYTDVSEFMHLRLRVPSATHFPILLLLASMPCQ